MKKSIVTLFLICVTASAWAADLPKQGFGVQIGWAQPILRVNSPSSNPKDSLTSTLALKGFKVRSRFVHFEFFRLTKARKNLGDIGDFVPSVIKEDIIKRIRER